MPVTPIHFCLGVVGKTVIDRTSLGLFIASNVAMDVQPILAVLTGQGELHGWTHTIEGATLVGILTYWLMAWWWRSRMSPLTATLSIAFGVYSHILMDAMMHSDMSLTLFAEWNPLYLGMPFGMQYLDIGLGTMMLASFFMIPVLWRRHFSRQLPSLASLLLPRK